MSEFDRLAPYIQEFIYEHRWEELKGIQVAACKAVFDTSLNILLASGTASGKTEAAFLPALTAIYNNPSSSVAILYISPLKSLINDQFFRLNDLLTEADITVTRWHGDVSADKKKKLLKHPDGVLQITPESLESMLMNRREELLTLFADLRFIIIDEVHYFMGNPRGIQLLCVLERITRLVKVNPRRIGLSATLGNSSMAEKWLNSGTGRLCITPEAGSSSKRLSLAVDYFPAEIIDKFKTAANESAAEEPIAHESSAGIIAEKTSQEEQQNTRFYESIYRQTLGNKCIIFTNTRAEAELTIAYLKKIAKAKGTPDVYRVHHGNISAFYREATEKEMKESELPLVTGATVTLELGIDIGTLDRVVQIDAPFTVSSFVQRLGRCGRQGQPAKMYFAFREKVSLLEEHIMKVIDWDFLRCIAIIELYIKDHWIEENQIPSYPMGLLYHQTMSYIVGEGEVSAPGLAQYILTLSPFRNITQEDYKILLKHLLETGQLMKTERGGLMLGVKGERIISHFEFLSVFETVTEYSVKQKTREIGTVMALYPKGYKFNLAGMAWEVVDLDEKNRTIFVEKAAGIAKTSWISLYGQDMDTTVVKKMRDILLENLDYRYLSPFGDSKLKDFRRLARASGILENIVRETNKFSIFEIYPWIGTRQMRALSLMLEEKGCSNRMNSSFSIEVSCQDRNEADILRLLKNITEEPFRKEDIRLEGEPPVIGKYNRYLPLELLEKEFLKDYVDDKGMKRELGDRLSHRNIRI